jgi:hypothetical protein
LPAWGGLGWVVSKQWLCWPVFNAPASDCYGNDKSKAMMKNTRKQVLTIKIEYLNIVAQIVNDFNSKI